MSKRGSGRSDAYSNMEDGRGGEVLHGTVDGHGGGFLLWWGECVLAWWSAVRFWRCVLAWWSEVRLREREREL